MKVNVTAYDGHKTEVDAEQSRTAGLVIHEGLNSYDIGRFVVATANGGVRLASAADKATARLIAGAFGGFPIKWAAVTANSEADCRQVVAVIKERLTQCPLLLKWCLLVSDVEALRGAKK